MAKKVKTRERRFTAPSKETSVKVPLSHDQLRRLRQQAAHAKKSMAAYVRSALGLEQ
jgi:hypothetical protein